MSEQRLEGFAKAKTATPFIVSEQERQDNIFGFGQAQFVIPHLLRDLKEKIRSRNESGMTAVSCHCEVPEARHHVRQYSCALSCHPEATAEGSQEVNEILKHLTASPTDAGSHNSFLVGSLCKVQHDKYVSKAHRKDLNVLTSYRLNDFKKKAGATHVDMSDNIRRVAFTFDHPCNHRCCRGYDYSDINCKLQRKTNGNTIN